MHVVIIVQARMTSSRLPGKVLKTILGKSLLDFQIERLAKVRNANQIVIATTTNSSDQPIIDFCHLKGIAVFRGSEQDVLSRYHGAAKKFQADIVVRVTSDCPLIDPCIIDQVIDLLENCPELDYTSNIIDRTFPRGLDCEAVHFKILDTVYKEAVSQADREHVTPFIYSQPTRFKLGGIKNEKDLSNHRWTVDTIEDFDLIQKMLAALYPVNPDFLLQDCLELLAQHPDWPLINAEIEQKKTYN
jgi:spore coat polysaccharide biosynthesis protein SpsF